MREGENLWYIDGTLGGAGHALAIAEAFDSKVNILGLDQDETAIERAKELLTGKCDRLVLVNENFRNLDKVMSQSGIETADMILLDLGLSSDELENSGRGFTFQKDEPLHMTYGNPDKQPFTALDIVNGWKEEDIANVIFGYGEERYARRVARRIVEYRTKKPIETSMELAEIVKGSMPRMFRKPKIHPATKTFQALRIAVNDELNALREGLAKGYSRLGKEGKIAVISFHSLEDRIVKEFFRSKESEDGAKITKKPIRAGAQEVAENPRSRSAKLRILQKKQ
jgi:16S rRNA (cytosine1402-N4)-methyltransferase